MARFTAAVSVIIARKGVSSSHETDSAARRRRARRTSRPSDASWVRRLVLVLLAVYGASLWQGWVPLPSALAPLARFLPQRAAALQHLALQDAPDGSPRIPSFDDWVHSSPTRTACAVVYRAACCAQEPCSGRGLAAVPAPDASRDRSACINHGHDGKMMGYEAFVHRCETRFAADPSLAQSASEGPPDFVSQARVRGARIRDAMFPSFRKPASLQALFESHSRAVR